MLKNACSTIHYRFPVATNYDPRFGDKYLTDMKNYTEKEVHDLIRRFEARELPKSEWTHEAHLVVAVWYCSHYPMEEALPQVRENITRHNETVGTPNTDDEGYHETITRFWLMVGYDFLHHHHFDLISEGCNALINSERGSRNYPLQYYSESLLFSVPARYEWTPPDLASLEEDE